VSWTVANVVCDRQRAATIGLVGLVGTQLMQTVRVGGRDPVVLAATAGSFGALAGVVETPIVNRFFNCVPLGPVGWGIGLGSSLAATLATPIAERVVDLRRRSGQAEERGP
jgi:hypothetical protein